MDDTDFEAHLEFSGDESTPALLVLTGELDVSAAEVLTSTLEQVNTSAPALSPESRWPPSGRRRPSSASMVEVFPAPLRPNTQVTAPAPATNDNPCTATTSP